MNRAGESFLALVLIAIAVMFLLWGAVLAIVVAGDLLENEYLRAVIE